MSMRHFLENTAINLYEPVLGPVLHGLRRQIGVSLQERILPSLEQQQRSRPWVLLDCCCGAGGLLKMLAAQENMFLMGLDKDIRMLNVAQRYASRAFLIQGDGMQLPFGTGSVQVATLCMAVHTLPLQVAQALVQELLRVASYVFIADYCLAERNIHMPAAWLAHGVEFFVGGEHYACYKNFMRLGALEGFLYAEGHEPLLRRSVLGGAGQLVMLQGHVKV